MARQLPQILIPDHKHRRMLGDALVDPTSRSRGKIGGLAPRNCQRACKHEDLSKKLALGITFPHRLHVNVIEMMNWLSHPYQPLFWANTRLRDGTKQQLPGAPGIFEGVVTSVINTEMGRHVRQPAP